jgi:dihydrofolate synthase / folylpolyglutamate synthase
MEALVDVLGEPQRAYPVIHLTGTNGKGSVARMVTALLSAHGLTVGTYTSPHLERVNERITRDGQPIGDDDLVQVVELLRQVEPLVVERTGRTPSWFELLTAAAYLWFSDVAVDVAVVEVGLLGRWDATNVADGTVAVVTNVEGDHTDFAPGWRVAVATEKAGIVKPGATLVLGEADPELRPVFAATPAERTWVRDEDFGAEDDRLGVGGRVVTVRTPNGVLDDLLVPVWGAHQGENLAVAVAATEAFFDRALDRAVTMTALAELTLPGRCEVVRHHPLVVLDGAHNAAGAEVLATTMAEDLAFADSQVLVVGALQGRDAVALLEALRAPAARLVVATEPPTVRGLPAAELGAAALAMGAEVEVVPDAHDAVGRALAVADPDDLVCVTGSLYLVGAVRPWLLPA